jgi:hypothetical protein
MFEMAAPATMRSYCVHVEHSTRPKLLVGLSATSHVYRDRGHGAAQV